MKRINIIGLCLVAVVAMSAIAVASASAALPEFKSTNAKVTFTSTSLLPLEPVLASNITGIGQKNIVCKMSTDKGEITSVKEVKKVLVTYTECKEEGAPTKACTTKGQAKGVVVTKDVKGKIGYVVGTGKGAVGTELEPETGTVFAEFTCAGEAEEVTVEGCTIGEATPLNKSQTTGLLKFEENAAKTGQRLIETEGGTHKPCELKVTAGFFKLGKGTSWIMDTEHEVFAENVELKA
jgi:hypothetical protein